MPFVVRRSSFVSTRSHCAGVVDCGGAGAGGRFLFISARVLNRRARRVAADGTINLFVSQTVLGLSVTVIVVLWGGGGALYFLRATAAAAATAAAVS